MTDFGHFWLILPQIQNKACISTMSEITPPFFENAFFRPHFAQLPKHPERKNKGKVCKGRVRHFNAWCALRINPLVGMGTHAIDKRELRRSRTTNEKHNKHTPEGTTNIRSRETLSRRGALPSAMKNIIYNQRVVWLARVRGQLTALPCQKGEGHTFRTTACVTSRFKKKIAGWTILALK